VIEVVQSATFSKWLSKLADRRARARILVRIDRLAAGNPGDVKSVGSGISEMRIDYGPGYRLYFVQRGELVTVLLCGGDKRTQDADIKRAVEIANTWPVAPAAAASPSRNTKDPKKGAKRRKE
jgi:putative addiction module killer protein